jgi:hypothetical protein
MSATARARIVLDSGQYWEQFFSALSCVSKAECDEWMEREVSRYVSQFGLNEETAWRTIACNLAFFAGYLGASAVKSMRKSFGVFPECFDSPEYKQAKRSSMNDSGRPAADSPV